MLTRVNKKKLNRGCFTETVYVEAWCDVQIHEALWKVLYVMKCSRGVPSVMLGRSIFFCLFQVYWACTQFRLLLAVCLVVYLNKHNIDNDINPGSF